MMPKHEWMLIITSPDGNDEFQIPNHPIPQIGSGMTVRKSDGNVLFEGKVEHVHYGLRTGYNNDAITGYTIVSVWLS